MGDVAILMSNKFTGMQTIMCNGFVNFMSLIGVIIGLLVTNLNDGVKTYIMAFVAGNFMYISGDIWKNIIRNKNLFMNMIEMVGFAIGVGIMYVVLYI